MNMTENPFAQGKLLLVDKPLHWTSFNVVSKIRSLSKTKKVGHAGTLDPLATGLLIVCTGKFTKKINEYMAQEKEYTGTITLGAVTPTYDLESAPQDQQPVPAFERSDLQAATAAFTGLIYQKPPIHSAIKIDGKRVYELARKGAPVEMQARPVTIHSFDITNWASPVLHFTVVCGTGTYIRSLANDFGAALGCGGYLSSLCRTRIGNFNLAEASTIEALEQQIPAARSGSSAS